MNVLLVEHSGLVRDRVRKMLATMKNLEVVGEASSLEDARSAIQKFHPHILLLDVRLSDGSGLGLLREMEGESDLPVKIVFTNYSDSHMRTACMMAGADFFFDKSKEVNKLKTVLRRLSTMDVNL
jgi:two-component system response regulator DevR